MTTHEVNCVGKSDLRRQCRWVIKGCLFFVAPVPLIDVAVQFAKSSLNEVYGKCIGSKTILE